MSDTEQKQENAEKKMNFHVPQDLEYVYRDIFNVYVGSGDVVIEFGNQHRAMPDHAGIYNRIVLSVSNAYTLIQTLNQALAQAQVLLQKSLQDKQLNRQ